MSDEGLRRAVTDFLAAWPNIENHPHSNPPEVAALRAAVAARSEPQTDFGSQGGPTTGYGTAAAPALDERLRVAATVVLKMWREPSLEHALAFDVAMSALEGALAREDRP